MVFLILGFVVVLGLSIWCAYNFGFALGETKSKVVNDDYKIVVTQGNKKQTRFARFGIYKNDNLVFDCKQSNILPQFIFNILGEKYTIFQYDGEDLPSYFEEFIHKTPEVEYDGGPSGIE